MRVTRTWAPALLALAVAVSHADARDAVRAVEYRSDTAVPVDRPFLDAVTRVRPGDEMDADRVAADVRKLLESGRFSDVRALIARGEGGVDVVYAVRSKYRLGGGLDIRGNDHFSESRILEWVDLRSGDLVDDAVLGARTRKLLEEYRDDYFMDASVGWEITETDPTGGVARVVLNVREGARAKIREFVFDGNQTLSDKELRKYVKSLRWWNPFSWFGAGRYDPEKLESGRNEIQRLYANMGHLGAEVGLPRVDREKDGSVLVTFPVTEGPAYRVGTTALGGSGTNLFPRTELARAVALKEGQTAGADVIDKGAKGVRDYFGSRGYINTRVKTVLDPDPAAGTVNVQYLITEGELTHIRNIYIRGNSRTRDKVIRRELQVYPGEIFNEVKVTQSERIVQNLGFFSTVRSDAIETRYPDEKDLVLTVEEKRTGQFMVGAGFSSIDNLIGFAEISQGNFDIGGYPYFTGGGQKVKARMQVGETRKEYEVSFTEPWFLDRKLSLGVEAYRNELSYSEYDVKRTGGAVSLSRPLPGPHRATVRYNLEDNEIYDIADTNLYVYADETRDEFYFSEEEDFLKSTMRLTLQRDTRNTPFFPTRGTQASVFGEVSGGPLGADLDIYSLGAGSRTYYTPWLQHVVSLRARWEIIDGYGDTDEVPLSERLYCGGGRTLRGYEYRDVGPKVVPATPLASGSDGHRPAGGQSLALLSVEYTIPIVSKLRFATFYDIGGLWRDAYEFDRDTLASSTGVGLRLDIPGFPIRVDYAWPLDTDSELTDEDNWVIWVGFE